MKKIINLTIKLAKLFLYYVPIGLSDKGSRSSISIIFRISSVKESDGFSDDEGEGQGNHLCVCVGV